MAELELGIQNLEFGVALWRCCGVLKIHEQSTKLSGTIKAVCQYLPVFGSFRHPLYLAFLLKVGIKSVQNIKDSEHFN